MINGINVAGLSEFTHEVKGEPRAGTIKAGTHLTWENGTQLKVSPKTMVLGEHRVARDFEIAIDEPRQLLGLNSAPNPQEYLLGALSGCMAVVFMMGASMMKLDIEKLEIEVTWDLDLRGFLGLDETVPVEVTDVSYSIRVKGSGTPEQYEALHERVRRYSPNYNTLLKPIPLVGRLICE